MKCSVYRKISLFTLVYGVLFLSACATAPATPQKSTIEQRVTERWDKLLSGDIAGAYEYLSPGYRSSVSSIDYQRFILLKQVRWTGASYKSSECENQVCDVKVLLSYRVSGAIPGVKSYDGEQDIVEQWVQIDGMWYLVP